MAKREGLIDTAVKIAETGYIQRQSVKALEDVVVCLHLCINAVNCSLSEDRCSTAIGKALKQQQHVSAFLNIHIAQTCRVLVPPRHIQGYEES